MTNQSELIKQLRAMTQAGFMDCKKALENCNNVLDEAVKWLRENGITKAAKKIDSVAAEGIISIHANEKAAVMVEINSQTDFVTKNQMFMDFAKELTKVLFETKSIELDKVKNLKLPSSNQTVADTEIDLTAKIGEKISVRRIVYLEAKENESIGHYLHANNRIGVILLTSSTSADNLKHLAMHIAANSPKFINAQDVDKKWLENEREVILSQIKIDETVKQKIEKAPEDKKQDLLNKIIDGRVNKLLSESCLYSQTYLVDPSLKVADFLSKNKINVLKMIRYEVGEGIEKKETDFAAEVQAQMKR